MECILTVAGGRRDGRPASGYRNVAHGTAARRDGSKRQQKLPPAPRTAMILLDTLFERTLDAWERQYGDGAWRGATLEGWLFEGRPARRAAEDRLARAGITADRKSTRLNSSH